MPDTIFCPNCGERISARARFCPSCGASQDEFRVDRDRTGPADARRGQLPRAARPPAPPPPPPPPATRTPRTATRRRARRLAARTAQRRDAPPPPRTRRADERIGRVDPQAAELTELLRERLALPGIVAAAIAGGGLGRRSCSPPGC